MKKFILHFHVDIVQYQRYKMLVIQKCIFITDHAVIKGNKINFAEKCQQLQCIFFFFFIKNSIPPASYQSVYNDIQ